MERPATWKVVTVGAAMAGLGLVGAGAANAATGPAAPAVTPGVDAPLFSPVDWSHDTFDGPDQSFVAMDDDTYWDDTFWDD